MQSLMNKIKKNAIPNRWNRRLIEIKTIHSPLDDRAVKVVKWLDAIFDDCLDTIEGI